MLPLPPITGEDPAFLDAVELLSRIAPLDRPCLVVGERGTGKELFTTRVHYLSRRWEKPLVKLNCATLTEGLLESELFGHEAGAFTGAQRRHPGRFERAHGGTLVLDEIASASLAVQEKVLRVIEYGEFERVGGNTTLEADVRVVGASNVDLPSLARRGEFRADLLDRLAFEVVTLPPLRARISDILPLARNFALEITRELERELFGGFSREVEARLLDYRWPGNVRELKNVVERAVYRAPSGNRPIERISLDPFDSPWRPGGATPGGAADQDAAAAQRTAGFHARVAAFEQRLLGSALATARYNQTAAAQALGLGYHQLRRLLQKHGLLGARPGRRDARE